MEEERSYAKRESPVASDGPRMLRREAHADNRGCPVSERIEAVSILLASEANRAEREVADFRRRHLGEDLLLPEEVQDWILSRAEAGREGHVAVEMELPAGFGVSLTRRLAYGVPQDPGRRTISVAEGSVLDRLRKLCVQLASDYNWDEAQASLFVLTNEIPVVADWAQTIQARGKYSVNTRMTLVIDPVLTPQEVMKRYRDARKTLLTGGRYRSIGPKHMDLAVFASAQPETSTWQKRMETWNREHPTADYTPDYQYAKVSNFARDCVAARNRLLNPLGTTKGKASKEQLELEATP